MKFNIETDPLELARWLASARQGCKRQADSFTQKYGRDHPTTQSFLQEEIRINDLQGQLVKVQADGPLKRS